MNVIKKLLVALLPLFVLLAFLHHLFIGCIPPREAVPHIIYTHTEPTDVCRIDKFVIKNDAVRYDVFCRDNNIWG